ncbi:GspH/FimT family pseudopilin [Arenimonas sp. GDDSR-1]|uniref:GspH/FimT family pseudopilin n=1 Tax=Arenimonas sp. GDDSR-1 TaxID=2950125 RepID=UPI0026210BAB|nr:GspH/FimT family pseudopilin [Arenimonas sp. GDDSR-1]
MSRHSRGFSLIELVIGISVAGILAGVALPAFLSARYAGDSAAVQASLLSSLMQSSHKAALHGSRATLCPSWDGIRCNTSFDWSNGWIAFLDTNANREREPDERLILRQDELENARLISSSGRTRIVFQGNGGNAGSNVTFTLCDRRGADKAQTLVVSNTGNLRRGVPDAERIALACVF